MIIGKTDELRLMFNQSWCDFSVLDTVFCFSFLRLRLVNTESRVFFNFAAKEHSAKTLLQKPNKIMFREIRDNIWES